MKKWIKQATAAITAAVLLFSSMPLKTEAATQTISFPSSPSRSQSKTITIPNLKSVTSISVDTGTVSYTVNGNNVTITVNNGAPTGSHTPSKTVTDSLTNTTGSFPSSISYNSGGYSGTLYKSGSVTQVQTGGTYIPADSFVAEETRSFSRSGDPCNLPPFNAPDNIPYNSGGYTGTLKWVEKTNFNYVRCPETDGTDTLYATSLTIRYRGTVTRPEIDTRTYSYTQNYSGTVYGSTTYYYSYNVTLTYVDNTKPTLTLTTVDNLTLSEVSGFNTYTISGQMNDADVGDVITTKYQIDSNPAQIIATNPSTGSPQSFSKTITIDSTIPEGIHVLKVWVEDDKGGNSSIESRNFVVDKTPPAAPTFSEDPIGQAVSKTVTINFPSDANVKEYKIDDENWTIYTEPLTLTKNATIYARAIDIAGNESVASHSVTSIGPPNPIVNVVELSEDSVKVTDTQTYPDPVERQFSILKDGQNIQASSWTDEEEYTFSGLAPNTIYDVQVDVRFK